MAEYFDQESGTTLLDVTRVTDAGNGDYIVQCQIKDKTGGIGNYTYPYSPLDVHGASKVIKLWLDNNKGKYVVQPKSAIVYTEKDVNIERERRILKGCYVGEIYVTGDDTNKSNITNLGGVAKVKLDIQDTSTIKFRDGNNMNHVLTPQQVLNLWLSSIRFVSDMYEISWKLKEYSPVPQDFKDNSYWITPVEKESNGYVRSAN